ncbi:hypothetical protein RQP46_008403 [Phenoliferia psychrophenolica]
MTVPQLVPYTRPEVSTYFNTVETPSCLSLADTELYLARVELSPALALQRPSLQLLSDLLVANHTHIPYDSSVYHVSNEDWSGPSKPIVFCGGKDGMQLDGPGNFRRIVHGNQGGNCYAINSIFSALLRSFGFVVSEVGARGYLHRGKDAAVAGWAWSPVGHETPIVEWEGSLGKYVCDAGFGGGGCPYPVLLKDGETSPAISDSESFLLKSERLPTNPGSLLTDAPSGWTFYRRIIPPNTRIDSHLTAGEGPGHWSPVMHFTIETLDPGNILMAQWFHETHPAAPFSKFFVVSRLLADGRRRTLSFGAAPAHMNAGGAAKPTLAKLYTKDGINNAECDVEWMETATGPVGAALRRDFGFKI